MSRRTWWKHIGAAGLLIGLVVGATSTSQAVPPALPPGTVVTCTQISGALTMTPGIGLTGTSSGVKWKMKAVANNCTATIPSSAGTVSSTPIFGAVVTGSGYIVGGNTCAAAAVAANYGASTMKVQWIASPAWATTTYSTVATGAFLPGTTTDLVGLTHDRSNVGPTPVSLQLGGDWTLATATQLATDCSGPAPASQVAMFQTPAVGSPHLPAFVASI